MSNTNPNPNPETKTEDQQFTEITAAIKAAIKAGGRLITYYWGEWCPHDGKVDACGSNRGCAVTLAMMGKPIFHHGYGTDIPVGYVAWIFDEQTGLNAMEFSEAFDGTVEADSFSGRIGTRVREWAIERGYLHPISDPYISNEETGGTYPDLDKVYNPDGTPKEENIPFTP